jgi:hypothetical protein
MIKYIKSQILFFSQDILFKCWDLRDKIHRYFNPRPRSFWDLE